MGDFIHSLFKLNQMQGWIYKITSPSGKMYIGQTIDINRRVNDYKKHNCKFQRHLYHSLQKYEWINHKFEIIEEFSSEQFIYEILNASEVYWIAHFDTFKNGMNLTTGGRNCRKSEESKRLTSISLKRWYDAGNVANRGVLTEEGRQKIIETGKKRKGKISQKQVDKMLETRHANAKERGYYYNPDLPKRDYKPPGRAVLQYDLEGNFIQEFASVADAGRAVGTVDSSPITGVCRGHHKMCKGFIWKYKEEVI